MTLDLCITKHDLAGLEIAAKLRLHLDEMYQRSPPDSIHTMPIERLRAPDVTLSSAWDGDRLAGWRAQGARYRAW